MTGQATWAIVIVVVVAAALIGFFLGRVNGNGMKQKVKELEESIERKDAELTSYKREVDSHFDQTATLFVSMAGSYKALFEHLSSGYEKLSEGSSRDLFRERVATLLLDGPGLESEERVETDWQEASPAADDAAFEQASASDDDARDELERTASAEAETVEEEAPAQETERRVEPAEAVAEQESVSPAEAEGPTGAGNEPAPVAEESVETSRIGAGDETSVKSAAEEPPAAEQPEELREEETAEAGRRN